jgi:uncharacterized protein YjdB
VSSTPGATITVTAATLTAIVVSPPNRTIAKGTSLEFTANGVFSDLSTEDLTTQVDWSSAPATIATVSNAEGEQGVVTGSLVNTGTATITATSPPTLGTVSGSTMVTVTSAALTSITILPADESTPLGIDLELTASCNFSDGTTEDCTNDPELSWTSSNTGIATVGSSGINNGLVKGVATGSTTITAQFGTGTAAVKGSTTVTVTSATLTSITVTPTDKSIAQGTFIRLTATGTFSDGSTDDITTLVTWTSTDNAVAQPGNGPLYGGLVFGRSVGGPETITATLDGQSDSTTVTVTDAILVAIVVAPVNPTFNVGGQKQLVATGIYSDGSFEDLTEQASWTSANTDVATVGSSIPLSGLVTGVAVGTASITATFATLMDSTTVTVAPVPAIVYAASYATSPGNTIYAWTINNTTGGAITPGSLTPVPGSPFPNPGSGARRMAADPTGHFLYVVDQLSSNIIVYSINPSTGVLTPIQQIDVSGVLPRGLTVDQLGKFLYTGQQVSATDTTAVISGFGINPDGSLTFLGTAPSQGLAAPFAMVDHPSDNFLYVSGETSNNIGGYRVNTVNGTLTPVTSSPPPPFSAPGMAGPLGIALDPLGEHLYVANVSNAGVPGSVSGFTVDDSTGGLEGGTNNGRPGLVVFPIGLAVADQGLAEEPLVQGVAEDPNDKVLYVVGQNRGGCNSGTGGSSTLGAIGSFIIHGASLADTGLNLTPGAGASVGTSPQSRDLFSAAVDPTHRFLYVADDGLIPPDCTTVSPGAGILAYEILPGGGLTLISSLNSTNGGPQNPTGLAVVVP